MQQRQEWSSILYKQSGKCCISQGDCCIPCKGVQFIMGVNEDCFSVPKVFMDRFAALSLAPKAKAKWGAEK